MRGALKKKTNEQTKRQAFWTQDRAFVILYVHHVCRTTVPCPAATTLHASILQHRPTGTLPSVDHVCRQYSTINTQSSVDATGVHESSSALTLLATTYSDGQVGTLVFLKNCSLQTVLADRPQQCCDEAPRAQPNSHRNNLAKIILAIIYSGHSTTFLFLGNSPVHQA